MALDFLRRRDCAFSGPALPEPFVRFELERALRKQDLLPETDGLGGEEFREQWEVLRRKLRDVSPNSGPLAIANRILEPLVSRLGYHRIEISEVVVTREGEEDGGRMMASDGGARLRCWTVDYDAGLDSPTKRGHAYRFSPSRVAPRVLLVKGERAGLITDGVKLRLLLCDPARPDSHLEIDLNAWRGFRDPPESYQLLIALAGPKGIAALPAIIEQARLQQNRVTKELRVQARLAVEKFVQCVLDHPENVERLAAFPDKSALAKKLWHEGLILVYRLLFILKCESTNDPSRVFRFASTSLWRNTYSPSTALARIVRRVLDEGAQSGRYLECGLRVLFRMFAEGLDHPGLTVRPLGGALFGAQSTPQLSNLCWGEQAVAHLLDHLLWTTPQRGGSGRHRVHYGPLDVEDLGRVYEALLELEPGISVEPMCRLRRAKLEVVVPKAQGEKYKPKDNAETTKQEPDASDDNGTGEDATDADDTEPQDEEAPSRGKKTKVEWIEAIPAGRFYLRVGLGRKSSGSYYTPHSFVRFLVQETLGPQCDERSPRDNPHPGEILKLKVLDPACGSGHFLVEACRFLAGKLYEAARLCDEKAAEAEAAAEQETDPAKNRDAQERAEEFRTRLSDLPDNDDELLAYLPARAPEGAVSGYSQAKAEAICRRLVAVHCLYGVDLNPLAVELAKLSLWIESHAEGLPLTFLDHRVVLGNSLTGPFWDKLTLYPGKQEPVTGLFLQNLDIQLSRRLGEALSMVRELEAHVGIDLGQTRKKQELKAELDRQLIPFRILAAAWSGGVMLGTKVGEGEPRCDDGAYAALLKTVGETGDLPAKIEDENLVAMIGKGLGLPLPSREGWGEGIPRERDALLALAMSGAYAAALPYDLAFPEVFHPTGIPHGQHGFDAVVGNPPWEGVDTSNKEFFAAFDFSILELETEREITDLIASLLRDPAIETDRHRYEARVTATKKLAAALLNHVNRSAGGVSAATPDLYQYFTERAFQCLGGHGRFGLVLPAAVHANEGSAGLRILLLHHMAISCCYSFENKRKLFEIHSSFKFATIVAQRGGPTQEFACAFYLHDDEWLFQSNKCERLLTYSFTFIRLTTGNALNLLELRDKQSVPIVYRMYETKASLFGDIRRSWKVLPTEELHTSKQKHRVTPIHGLRATFRGDVRTPDTHRALLSQGIIPVCKGEDFHQFDSFWDDGPLVATTIEAMSGKEDRLKAARYYRLVFRRQASSTNERTVICHLCAPGLLFFDSALPEKLPQERPTYRALAMVSICNSFSFDWLLRQMVGSNVTFNFLDVAPVPEVSSVNVFMAHCCARLVSQHAGYDSFWREQLGDAWREPGKKLFTWPALAGDDERWAVRAAIDVVVADAYGLSREQYAHVLSTFSHKSYRKAPELCLAAFDELKDIGLEAFCKKHDPYWDIPLNENLPKPVIDLPIPEGAENEGTEAGKKRGAKRSGRNQNATNLWEERDGQLTLNAPGPLFDSAGSPASKSRVRSAPPTPNPGHVAAVRTKLELDKVLTSAEVQDLLKCDASAARAILKQLVDAGIAVTEGKAKGTKYRFAAK